MGKGLSRNRRKAVLNIGLEWKNCAEPSRVQTLYKRRANVKGRVMTQIRKPISPMYIEMVKGYGKYKVQALCNLCGRAMLTPRYYCSVCHEERLLQRVCPICGNTFIRDYKRKYCQGHTRIEIHKYGALGLRGTTRQNIMKMEGTQSAIARDVGVSRQRVHQILKSA